MERCLSEYRNRTRGFMMDSLSGEGTFKTHPDLVQKVDERGRFCPFAGDTVVFDIKDEMKAMAAQMQDILYDKCAFMLSERLKQDTFHVTLHDLNNSMPYEKLMWAMKQSEKAAKDIIMDIRQEQAHPVSVRTVSVFNMVSKSVVLGLEPADDYSCMRLMELHERFQSVVQLNYPLTLHITLAYYRPGEYSADEKNMLKQTFEELSGLCGREYMLDDHALMYQRFEHMNRYML